jgi:hypothetical protein
MNCRYCTNPLTHTFVDLGSAPPSNNYLTADNLKQPELWLPLRVLVCDECFLVQTEDFSRAENLFTDEYAYFSSFSSSWLDHAQKYVSEMITQFSLNSSSMVIEIAANDGYLLQYVRQAGIPCIGVEPTAGTAKAARKKGLKIVEEFFGAVLADKLRRQYGGADLMTANNVLAHVPDIRDFVKGFSILLNPDGAATFEFPHLLQLVHENQFDTIYHEHFSYLSLLAVEKIFTDNGLHIFDVKQLETHGGSLRVYAERSDGRMRPRHKRVSQILEKEKKAQMTGMDFYTDFQPRAERVKDDLLKFLLESKQQKLTVAAYGAAAKGNTLLNFAGIRPDFIEFVVDRNPVKQGKFLPGSRIPIVDEKHLKKIKPDLVLILPWNLRKEIMNQLSYIRDWKGQFLTAIPRLQVF